MSVRTFASDIEDEVTADWKRLTAAEFQDSYVYRYFDAADRLLYVGVTTNPTNRDRTHRKGAKWFSQSVRREVSGPFGRQIALGLEQQAIRFESPLHNRYDRNGYSGPRSMPWHEEVARRFHKRCDEDPAYERAAMRARATAVSEALSQVIETARQATA